MRTSDYSATQSCDIYFATPGQVRNWMTEGVGLELSSYLCVSGLIVDDIIAFARSFLAIPVIMYGTAISTIDQIHKLLSAVIKSNF